MSRFNYSPNVGLYSMEPATLGSCADCGQDQPLDGHLWKTPAGYLCPACIGALDDCAEPQLECEHCGQLCDTRYECDDSDRSVGYQGSVLVCARCAGLER